MGHAVGSALGVVHVLVVLVAQMRVVVVGHQLRKGPRSLNDAVRMLVEHLEKIALAWQQLGKQHGNSWIGVVFLNNDKTMSFA